MAIKVLIIAESPTSYMVTSMKGSLEHADFVTLCLGPVFTEGSLSSFGPEVILLMGGNYVDSHRDELLILQNYCLSVGKKIFIIGYKEEYLQVLRLIDAACVKGYFERPIKVDEMIEQLKMDSVIAKTAKIKRHILVVDDSGASLRLIKGWLEKDYRISVASSAAMAIGFLQENKPDLILLDYEMPICSGPQFLEMIRAEEKTAKIPVIFLTSKDDSDSVAAVLALKPSGYLLKTSPPKVILDAIAKFFSKRR